MNYDQLQVAKIKKEPIFFENAYQDVMSWELILKHLAVAVQQPNQAVRDNIHRTIGQAHFWHEQTITIDNAQLYYPKLDSIIEELSNALQTTFKAAFCVTALGTGEPTIGKHEDQYDVFYIQGPGSVNWHVLVGYETKIYTLNTGDMIFVPAGLTHEIYPMEPRSAISIMFNV
jgi:hypothetical protein